MGLSSYSEIDLTVTHVHTVYHHYSTNHITLRRKLLFKMKFFTLMLVCVLFIAAVFCDEHDHDDEGHDHHHHEHECPKACAYNKDEVCDNNGVKYDNHCLFMMAFCADNTISEADC